MRENSPPFPFKKRFLLPLVHSWYFTLSLGLRAPGWGWSQGGPPSGGPCAVLGGGEGTSMEEVGSGFASTTQNSIVLSACFLTGAL